MLGAGDSVRSTALAAFFLADLDGAWAVDAAMSNVEKGVGWKLGNLGRSAVPEEVDDASGAGFGQEKMKQRLGKNPSE